MQADSGRELGDRGAHHRGVELGAQLTDLGRERAGTGTGRGRTVSSPRSDDLVDEVGLTVRSGAEHAQMARIDAVLPQCRRQDDDLARPGVEVACGRRAQNPGPDEVLDDGLVDAGLPRQRAHRVAAHERGCRPDTAVRRELRPSRGLVVLAGVERRELCTDDLERHVAVPLLAQHVAQPLDVRRAVLPVARGCAHGLDEALLAVLEAYAWPGNVRELRNVIESMVLMSDGEVLGVDALPPELVTDEEGRAQGPGAQPAAAVQKVCSIASGEAELIRCAIAATHGNLTKAARELDIAKSTLYQKVKQYGLERDISRVRSQ